MAPTGRTGTLRRTRLTQSRTRLAHSRARLTQRWALIAALVLTGASCSNVVASAAAPPGPISGPDVSSWNHPNGACINWPAVAAGDATTPQRQFAFIKATEGTTYKNPYLTSCASTPAKGDWQASAAAGLSRGAYHYAKPKLPLSDAVEQADFFVATIGDQLQTATLAPTLDLEENGGLTPPQLILWTQIWLDTVRKSTGRVPIVYTYPNFWADSMAGSEAFHAYPVWMADYRDPVGPYLPLQGNWPQWTFWQYTSVARQPGISGHVDMSNFWSDATALSALADGTAPLAWTPTVPAAPVKVTGSPGNGLVTVSWLPADNGGALVTSYLVSTPSGQSITVGGTTTSVTIPGLTNGVKYSFTVTAANAIGTGAASTGSRAVIPQIPTNITSSLTKYDVGYGDSTAMNGTAVRTDTGAGVAGQPIGVWQRPAGTTTPWTQVATVTTDANGAATWPFTPTEPVDTRMTWVPSTPDLQPQTSFVRTVTVHDVPSSVVLAPPAVTARPGAAVTLSATVLRSDTGTGVGGALVDVSTKAAGALDWTPVGSVPAGPDGKLTWQSTPLVNTQVLFTYAAPAHWVSASATAVVSVHPSLSGTRSATSVLVNSSLHATGQAAPELAIRKAYLQRSVGTIWAAVAWVRVTAAGTFDFVVIPKVRGRQHYRVLVQATPSYVASVTKTWSLLVR